jgi:hypothetical protein
MWGIFLLCAKNKFLNDNSIHEMLPAPVLACQAKKAESSKRRNSLSDKREGSEKAEHQ